MSFKIIFGDICTMKQEVIVNSLGINSTHMGTICRNIVHNAYSKEIDDLIASKTNNKIFDTFITNAGYLPAKSVIHIVTPYKMNDDKENNNLKKAFKIVINTAIKNKFKSIAIPFIGTGANGYKNSDVFNAATEVSSEYVTDDGENEQIDIVLAIYNKKIEKDMYETLEKERYNLLNLCTKEEDIRSSNERESSYMPREVKASVSLNKIFAKAKYEEMFIPEDKIIRPMDFIDCYMNKYKIPKKEFHQSVISKDRSSRCRLGQRTLTKIDIYKATIFFDWNITVCLQLMSFAGYSFAPNDIRDRRFVKYLCLPKKAKNYDDFLDNYPEYHDLIADEK